MAGANKALLLVAIAAGCYIFCLCSTTVLAARELGDDDAAMAARHEQWMALHGRVYEDAAEKAYRLEVFKANVAFIESFNAAGNHKFWLGVNQFTDLTNDEFRATRTNRGIIKQDGVARAPTATGFKYSNVSTDALPTSVDWRTKGAVTPIKNQGQCGK
jgi:hypothetical protein